MRYSLIRDFIGSATYDLSAQSSADLTDSVAVDAYCIIAVLRWKQPVTFSRDLMASRVGLDNSNIADLLDILTIDVMQQASVQSTKGSYISTLNAHLLPDRNYAKEILGGDWVFCWMVNDAASADSIKQRIQSQSQCNLFMDGLKFVGKVESCRENLMQDENGGLKAIRYDLVAGGFKEYQNEIFYNPYLVRNFSSINEYLAALNSSLDQLIAQKGEGVDSNLIMPFIFDLLLGRGVPSQFSNPGQQLQIVEGATNYKDAPYAYVLPKAVGAFLGRTVDSKGGGQLTYADITDTVIGLQRYSGNVTSGSPGDIFSPDGVDLGGYSGNRKTTSDPLLGIFTPTMISFTNKDVWSILSQFLNAAINEMYTCLRTTPTGEIVPTFIARQRPLTSAIGKVNNDKAGVRSTPFLELPRWHLHDILIKTVNRGRSEGPRFNFIVMTGQDLMTSATNSPTEQVIRNGVIRDEIDAKRHGLRPYQQSVACNHKDTVDGPYKWQHLAADWLMNQELTWNGTFTTVGIQAPVCIGDNLEFDSVVYHIETIVHQFDMQPNGKKRFVTTFQVTHGLAADPQPQQPPETNPQDPKANQGVQSQNEDTTLFHGVRGNGFIGGAPRVGEDRFDGQTTVTTPNKYDPPNDNT